MQRSNSLTRRSPDRNSKGTKSTDQGPANDESNC
ncbi:hypothetical protein AVEN_132949-1, partial [Araneus ventricosus]